MKKIDLIITCYGIIIFIDILFLVFVNRMDIFMISGPISLIPLRIQKILRFTPITSILPYIYSFSTN
ncbi:MAG: hypothetical protein ACFFBP_10760 [Promethearchaeota archaeon]